MARFPIVRDDGTVTVSTRYGQIRRSPADGACGFSGKYPCTHWGVDLTAPKGTPVLAPESGVIVEVANGAEAPWRGYGPGLAVLLGSSGAFHLLSHLDPEVIARWSEMGPLDSKPKLFPLAKRVSEGDTVGLVSSANHTHWEVRRKRIGDNATNTVNPGDWLRAQPNAYDEDWINTVTTAPGVVPGGSASKDAGGLVVLLLLYLVGRKRR